MVDRSELVAQFHYRHPFGLQHQEVIDPGDSQHAQLELEEEKQVHR